MSINKPTDVHVSIIIPAFNARRSLIDAVNSILSQTFENWEIIIVDGGSSDGSAEYLQGLDDPRISFISERDGGIYDAMNKGIGLSKGKWLYFLGADDKIYDSDLLFEFSRECSGELVVGRVQYDNGISVEPYFGSKLKYFNKTHHQGCFYSRALFSNFRYDVNLKVVGDYELNFLSYVSGRRAMIWHRNVAMCGSFGVSRADKLRNHLDCYVARAKHISSWKNVVYTCVALGNMLRRSILK